MIPKCNNNTIHGCLEPKVRITEVSTDIVGLNFISPNNTCLILRVELKATIKCIMFPTLFHTWNLQNGNNFAYILDISWTGLPFPVVGIETTQKIRTLK